MTYKNFQTACDVLGDKRLKDSIPVFGYGSTVTDIPIFFTHSFHLTEKLKGIK